jgi:hypothetical protein
MQPTSPALQSADDFTLGLAWLRQAIDPRIAGFKAECIKSNPALTRVHRVTLAYGGGHPGCRSIIVKTTGTAWPDDPHGPDRECWFYTTLSPRLGFDRPRLFHCEVDPVTGGRILVLEDLAEGYRFPAPTHRWSSDEARCALRAYARLHYMGLGCLHDAEERARLWQPVLQRLWSPEEILTPYEDLVRRGTLMWACGIERLVARTLIDQVYFADRTATFLHNDVYPPNIALPHDLTGEAVLVDWEMLGWGMAELDLAFMFMQPFRSAEEVDRHAALDYYWEQRRAMGGADLPSGERKTRQKHADACWALSLVPVAHQAVTQPYPDGSAERAYWDAMLGVLGERLAQLCRDT